MRHLQLEFEAATEGGEPEVVVCGQLNAEKTVCGNETQIDGIANIVRVQEVKAKVNCPI